jgi:hypothetical protein
MTVGELIELLEKHAIDGAHIDLGVGSEADYIDGYFDLEALAKELKHANSERVKP